jgi:hypothetical protein
MYQIKDTLVSSEVLEKKFVCDLQKCKGACCIEGDAGAPLEDNETSILEKIHEDVKPFMRKEGIEAIEEQGFFTVDEDGDKVTVLVKGKECAYVVFNEKGVTECAIEKAYNAKKIDFKKPISCHLYPIRVGKYPSFQAINYNEWHICKPACECGEKLDVKVYQFLKEPLIRKFGQEWFNELKEIDSELQKNSNKT